MATIICSKRATDGVILEIKADYEEYLQLQGRLDNIYLITEEEDLVKTNISQRGKNEATKYFLIPRELRKGFKFNNAASCKKIDYEDKVLFVYIIDKLKTVPSKRELVIKKYAAQEDLQESMLCHG